MRLDTKLKILYSAGVQFKKDETGRYQIETFEDYQTRVGNDYTKIQGGANFARYFADDDKFNTTGTLPEDQKKQLYFYIIHLLIDSVMNTKNYNKAIIQLSTKPEEAEKDTKPTSNTILESLRPRTAQSINI